MKHVRLAHGLPWLVIAVIAPLLGHCGGSAASTSDNELAGVACDALEQTLREQVTSSYADASKSCGVDADCTRAGDVGCYYTCVDPILSVTAKEAAQQSILESTAPVCAELTRRCGPRGPTDCPFRTATELGCVEGTCQVVSCDEILRRLSQRLTDLVEQARDCEVDLDCTLVSTSVRCVPDCGSYRSVRTLVAEQVSQGVKLAGSTGCSEYDSHGCPVQAQLPCSLPSTERHAACIAGRCDIENVPLR